MSSTKQDVNVGLVAFIGVVGAMVLLILALGVQAWFGYETDVIRQDRLDAADNVDWLRLKAEQYANIGDPVGNDTIYADEVTNPSRYVYDAEVGRQDYLLGQGDFSGYRFTSDDRDQLAVPIHAAMAAVVAQRGGPKVTAEQMQEIDREYVTLVNEAYESPLVLKTEKTSGRASGDPAQAPASTRPSE